MTSMFINDEKLLCFNGLYFDPEASRKAFSLENQVNQVTKEQVLNDKLFLFR